MRSSGGGIYIFVDVNGGKSPNLLHRDLFGFVIGSNGAILNSRTYSDYVVSIKYLISNGWKMNY